MTKSIKNLIIALLQLAFEVAQLIVVLYGLYLILSK